MHAHKHHCRFFIDSSISHVIVPSASVHPSAQELGLIAATKPPCHRCWSRHCRWSHLVVRSASPSTPRTMTSNATAPTSAWPPKNVIFWSHDKPCATTMPHLQSTFRNQEKSSHPTNSHHHNLRCVVSSAEPPATLVLSARPKRFHRHWGWHWKCTRSACKQVRHKIVLTCVNKNIH